MWVIITLRAGSNIYIPLPDASVHESFDHDPALRGIDWTSRKLEGRACDSTIYWGDVASARLWEPEPETSKDFQKAYQRIKAARSPDQEYTVDDFIAMWLTKPPTIPELEYFLGVYHTP
jgi:hypothetical protein